MGLYEYNPPGVGLIATGAIFEALAILAVGLRVWARYSKKVRLNANDYLIVSALFSATGAVVVAFVAVLAGGFGQHTADVIQEPDGLAKLVVFGKSFVAIQPFWSTSILLIKLSILDLYVTIFPLQTFGRICYGMMAICFLIYVYDILAAFLICQPVAFNWDPTIEGGHCGNEIAVYVIAHSLNFVMDSAIAILPIPVLMRLHMQFRKKLQLSLMFALGASICIISVLRIALWRSLQGTDLTYTGLPIYIFTIVEPLLAIVLACLPMLRPLGTQLANTSMFSWSKSLLGSSSRTKHSFQQMEPGESKSSFKSANEINRALYPTRTDTDIEGHAMDNYEGLVGSKSPPAANGAIQITTDYDVSST